MDERYYVREQQVQLGNAVPAPLIKRIGMDIWCRYWASKYGRKNLKLVDQMVYQNELMTSYTNSKTKHDMFFHIFNNTHKRNYFLGG